MPTRFFMKYIDPPIKLSDSHPEAHKLLVEVCQERGKIINEAIEKGEPKPKFETVIFKHKTKPVKAETKIGRNDPCPCGSGKKFKKCCGRVT